MPRTERVDFPGAVHHVYGRGNAKQVIFRDDDDRRAYLARLIEFKGRTGISILAYCLMANHYHLSVLSTEGRLSEFMQLLQQSYTRIFNDRWRSVGHVFQGRFENRVCENDGEVMSAIRYVHRNPVAARLCATPADWPWSGHRGLLGEHNPIIDRAGALGFFEDSSQRYEGFMNERHGDMLLKPLAEIVAEMTEGDVDLMLSPRRSAKAGRVRRDFIVQALAAGHRQSAIAKVLGRTPAAISLLLKKGA